MGENTTLANGTVLVYDVALHNGGLAYDITSGLFTCPVSGVYLFGIRNLVQDHNYCDVAVVKDDDAIAISTGHENSGPTMAISITHCDQDQTVKAQVTWTANGTCGTRAGHFSNFVGSLLYQTLALNTQVSSCLKCF